MKYFVLALLFIALPIYSTVTWLIESFSKETSTHQELVERFKIMHLNIFENMQTLGLLLLVLSIGAILLFSESRKVNTNIKFLAIVGMILSGIIALYQGWGLL